MHGRNDLPPGMDEAVAAFERWCRVRLLAAFQQAGLLAEPGARISAEDILALHPGLRASQRALSADTPDGPAAGSEGSQALRGPGAGHQRMVAALLETLHDAGFLEQAAAAGSLAPAGFLAATAVADAGVCAEVAALGGDAGRVCAGDGAALAPNVALVDACLGALPGILTGSLCAHRQAFASEMTGEQGGTCIFLAGRYLLQACHNMQANMHVGVREALPALVMS